MNSGEEKIVNLSAFKSSQEQTAANNSWVDSPSGTEVASQVEKIGARYETYSSVNDTGMLATERLYFDDEYAPVGQTVKFITQCRSLIEKIDQVKRRLGESEFFAADSEFMEFRSTLPALIPFRNLSEGVGLTILALLKTSQVIDVIKGHDTFLNEIRLCIVTLKDNPNLGFERANDLTTQLNNVVGVPPLVGYNEIVSMLLEELESEDTRMSNGGMPV